MTRDAHRFTQDDPPIIMPRKLAIQVLYHLEMWSDVVTDENRADPHLLRVIAELTALLEEGTPNG